MRNATVAIALPCVGRAPAQLKRQLRNQPSEPRCAGFWFFDGVRHVVVFTALHPSAKGERQLVPRAMWGPGGHRRLPALTIGGQGSLEQYDGPSKTNSLSRSNHCRDMEARQVLMLIGDPPPPLYTSFSSASRNVRQGNVGPHLLSQSSISRLL